MNINIPLNDLSNNQNPEFFLLSNYMVIMNNYINSFNSSINYLNNSAYNIRSMQNHIDNYYYGLYNNNLNVRRNYDHYYNNYQNNTSYSENTNQNALLNPNLNINPNLNMNPNLNNLLNYSTQDFINLSKYNLESLINNSISKLNYNNIANPLNESCAICQEDFLENEEVTIINECGHIFKSHHIINWLKQDQTCPNCRYNILTNSNIIKYVNSENMNFFLYNNEFRFFLASNIIDSLYSIANE